MSVVPSAETTAAVSSEIGSQVAPPSGEYSQVMAGSGYPVALTVKAAETPTVVVRSGGVVTVGASTYVYPLV